jgi:hypothetical protein
MMTTQMLFAAICLLAWVPTASAECGWVLWMGSRSPEEQVIYVRREVFSTRENCVRVIDTVEKSATGKTDFQQVNRESQTFIAVVGRDRRDSRTYMCLTDVMRPEDMVR